MLVEINLLPQKEANNRSLYMFSIILAGTLLIGGGVLYWLNKSYDNEIATLEQQIATTEQLIIAEQEKMLSYESSNSLVELENTVNWASDYPVKAVPILNKLTALLPDRGFIQSFSYEEVGVVNFSVQFEASREAAFYLNGLLDSEWVTEARMNQLNAVTGFYDRALGESDEGPDENKLKNETYIPRYLAEFEVTLNRPVLKDKTSSGEKEGDE